MKVKKVCKFCEKEYYVSPYRKDNSFYCSHSCRSSDRIGEQSGRWCGGMTELTCKFCNQIYYLYPSQAKESIYCSESCRSRATRLHGDKSNFWSGGLVEYKCKQCGKTFSDKKSHPRQYCSKACHHASRMNRVKGICKRCGNEFEVKASKAKRYKNEFCSFLCYGIAKFGIGNQNWRGGISFEPYPPTFNNQFKRMICERDNYTCAICKEYGNIVHHINYVKNDTVPENCITLCRSCHGKTNSNREYWLKYFS